MGAPHGAVRHDDGVARCPWPGRDPVYIAYHDTEWGMPETESRALFEKLLLDGFQAGLSWITILRKRDAFRAAFDGFDPVAIARYDSTKIETLMMDKEIVRNRAKIEAAVASARAYLALEAREGFAPFLWKFVDGAPIQNRLRTMGDAQAETDHSRALSKALKAQGFKFCGPTIVYAFMQATGMVNDHLIGCACHARCAQAAKAMTPTKGA